MKHFEIYTSAYYAGEPLCIISDSIRDTYTPDDLVEGVYGYAGDEYKRIIGDADQWVKIVNVYIKRGEIVYLKEVIEEEDKINA